MRILHLVTRSQRRGAEVVALELVRELDALGHEDRIVALGPAFDGSVVSEIPTLIDTPNLGAVSWIKLRAALRRELQLNPADIIVTHGGQPFETARLARLPRGTSPLVVWQRILPFPASLWKQPRRAWWGWLARGADGAVVLTSDLERELQRLSFHAPVWTIQNFRDSAPFVGLDRQAAATSLRTELGLALDTRVIGLVGHLIEQKRPERAVEVLAGVHARGEAAHLVIAGDGPCREQLERAVASAHLDGFVHLLGDRRDIGVVLGGIDVLVQTSESEGVPGVLIEALMAGCPVVAMNVGGIASVVDDGVTGMLVPPGDADALAGQVTDLLRDEPRRAAMTDAARSRSEEFAADRAARVYAEKFATLLSARGK